MTKSSRISNSTRGLRGKERYKEQERERERGHHASHEIFAIRDFQLIKFPLLPCAARNKGEGKNVFFP